MSKESFVSFAPREEDDSITALCKCSGSNPKTCHFGDVSDTSVAL